VSRSTDRSALSRVRLAAIIGLVGSVIAFLEVFVAPVSSFIAVSRSTSGTTLSLSGTGLFVIVTLAGFGLLFGLLELFYFRQAFRILAPQDPRFATPARLVLVAIVAFVLLFVEAVVLVSVLYRAALCAGAGNPITPVCLNGGTVLALVALLGAAGVVALIGYIGLSLGTWRLGTRFRERKFRVGAILLLIPVLNLVALVLIAIGSQSAIRALGSGMLASRGGTDLLLFVAGGPDSQGDSMQDVIPSISARVATVALPVGRWTQPSRRSSSTPGFAQPPLTEDRPWHLPQQQIVCATMVLRIAEETGKQVTVVDVDRPEGSEYLVHQWVGSKDVLPVLVRRDGARMKGVEEFVPQRVRQFMRGR